MKTTNDQKPLTVHMRLAPLGLDGHGVDHHYEAGRMCCSHEKRHTVSQSKKKALTQIRKPRSHSQMVKHHQSRAG